ncbi:FKBP-type peptidyl-prolyl cis-trans isomerase SlyD [Enhygromyxa salina]|uniref:Peptidyl-prolyl cis-trans isomerase n=1 Tax=Enhygromyxa salina TaxID=215803 RepID=A0A0C2CYK0_9BACT|nr:FKBP-type peptidyl-prolyl cis-trans isomerase [Enhygromyxa salina]KIG16071.1 FKBP-type peptidyl-prolyl cis-trans isomerase SlyD [Enhygromyxa salina]
MTALTRSLFCSCLLVSLAACIDPPSAADSGKPAAGVQPAAAGEQPKPAASTEPGFTGEPVSSAALAGGLIVDDFLIGTGEEAKIGSEVSVHYTGTLDDGTVFDTSKKRNRPYTFTIGEGRVIKGWDQGLPGMKVGGKRRLTVPAELAYGPRAKGKIPANSQLTFTLELVAVVPPLPDPKGDEAFAGEPLQKSELEGGLVIEDFALGEGRVAADGDNVAVHYTGKLDDGTVFDSSVPRKKAISFVLGTGRVIKGWDMGIAGMKVGGLRRLTIPSDLAYGSRAKGKIPADSRLTFTVELMSISDAPPQTRRPPARQPH